MAIELLDGTLQIEIFYDSEDQDLEDNICVSVVERCPPAERLLRSGQTNIFLTSEQARDLGRALIAAADRSEDVNTG